MEMTAIVTVMIIAIFRYFRNLDTVNAQIKIAEIESDKEIKIAKINKIDLNKKSCPKL